MMVKEKIEQAIAILQELQIDLWLTFVRETAAMADPILPLILGTGCTWQSVFLISARGDTIAIVGNLDAANIRATGAYQEVIGYTASIREELIGSLKKIKPRKIALNYATDDYMSDGLSHGLYLRLLDYLSGTPYAQGLCSAEPIISALRGRKSATEVARIREAIHITEEIWAEVTDFLRPGQSEKEIAAFINLQMASRGVQPAWDAAMCPSVFTGPDTAGAHFGPTNRRTEHGHIINMDFGVRKDDYCSDLQRTWYFLPAGETEPPELVQRGFAAIRDAIQKAAQALKPGVEGWTVDKIARDYIVAQGFEEFQHALGHQVGRLAHDGGGVLCPVWERYGDNPFKKVEAGQVYTLEPRLPVPGHGVITMEEIVLVTPVGAEFLSHPQTELWLVQ